ncbi:MAG: hypothetical protein J5911_04230 [Clostridia bacterium]|nr:hypothetical protein [Clostridia bacterium]
MYLERLVVKRFGGVICSDLKFKKGVNLIDCPNKQEIAFACCLAVGGGNFGEIVDKLMTTDSEISAEFNGSEGKFIAKITKNGDSVSVSGTESYKRIFADNTKRNVSCYFFVSDDSNAHEIKNAARFNRAFESFKDENYCLSDDFIKEYGVRPFRSVLNIYLRSIKTEPLNEDKSAYLQVQTDGKFTAVDGDGNKTAVNNRDKMVFDYYCFLKVCKFWKEIYRTKDINYPDFPLCIADLESGIDGERKDRLIRMALRDYGQVLVT